MPAASSESVKQKDMQVILAGVKLPRGKFEAWLGLNVNFSRPQQTTEEASSLFEVKVMKKRNADVHQNFESWFIRSGFCAPIYSAPQERANVLDQARVHKWVNLTVSPNQTPVHAASVGRSIVEKTKKPLVEKVRNSILDSHTEQLDQNRWYGKRDVRKLLQSSSSTLTKSEYQTVKCKSRRLLAERRREAGNGDVTFILEGDLTIDDVPSPSDTRSIACLNVGVASNPHSPITGKAETARAQTIVSVNDDTTVKVAGLRNNCEHQVVVSRTSHDRGHQTFRDHDSKEGKSGVHEACAVDGQVISDKMSVSADHQIEIDSRHVINKNIASTKFEEDSSLETTIQGRIDEANSAIRSLQMQQEQLRHDLNLATSRYADNVRIARLERKRLLETILSFVQRDPDTHFTAEESEASAAGVKRDAGKPINEKPLLQTDQRVSANTVTAQSEVAFDLDLKEKGSKIDVGENADTLLTKNVDTILIVEKAAIVAVSSAIARSAVRSDLSGISSTIAAGIVAEKAKLDALLSKTQEERVLLERERSQLVRQLIRERAEAAAESANVRGMYNKLTTQLIYERQNASAVVRSLRLRERRKAMALVSLAANVARSGVRLPPFLPKSMSGDPHLHKESVTDPSSDDGTHLIEEDTSTLTVETMIELEPSDHQRLSNDSKGTLGTIQTSSSRFEATGEGTSGVALVDKPAYSYAVDGRRVAGSRLMLEAARDSVPLLRADFDSATAEGCNHVASSPRVIRRSAESTLSLESASGWVRNDAEETFGVAVKERFKKVGSSSSLAASTRQSGLEGRLDVKRSPTQLGISTSQFSDRHDGQKSRKEHSLDANDPFEDCTDEYESRRSLSLSTAYDGDYRRDFADSGDNGETGLVPPSRDTQCPTDVPSDENQFVFGSDYVVCFARCSFEAITEHEIPMRVNQPFFVRAADITSGDWIYVHPCPSRDMKGDLRPSGYVPFAYISSPRKIHF